MNAELKPWERKPEVWQCPEHGEYGINVPDRHGHATWECPLCAGEAEFQVSAWKVEWDRHTRWLNHSGIPRRFRTRTLDSWEPLGKPNEAVRTAISGYVADLGNRIANGAGLVLLGPPGLGKSHLLTAIVAEAVKADYSAAYVVWPDVVSEVKAGFNLPAREERRDIIGILRERDLVALDELALKPGSTEFEHSLLFDLLDYRYRHQLPTLAASNATREGLAAAVGERIADRLSECSPLLVLTGKSQRAARPLEADDAELQVPQPPKELTVQRHRKGEWTQETHTHKRDPREF